MHALSTGSRFADRYVIDETLGVGAAGAVLAAHDPHHAAPERARVAIKVLRPELAADLALRARFRREATILQGIEHPAIVRVWAHGAAALVPGGPSVPYLVMERLAGVTLRSALQRGAQTPTAALSWLRPVAAALDRVHADGVLHGDLKPDNLFLTPTGPRLVDFGSAKVHGFPRLTATGEVAGTPRYMAPEVIAGERALDHRSDVYALAVTAYECLAGHPPFRARHPGRLLAEIMGSAAPPLERWPTLAPVLARGMRREPEHRFDTAGSLVQALSAAIAEAESSSVSS
ncbi:MAG: serine/threonine-protein kinase [Polyangiales bacterium]|nr:serine/threonine protein kinase [Myxococcales bacterium]MCB9657301.1 serine/threonine protein kinase [Sandaracinaceae bacterium]